MKKGLFIRLVLCIFFLGGCLYSYLSLQNSITKLRLEIPELVTKVRKIEEENIYLQYEIEKFESPANLLEIVKKNPFSHFCFPLDSAVVTLKQSTPLGESIALVEKSNRKKPKVHFATSAPVEQP